MKEFELKNLTAEELNNLIDALEREREQRYEVRRAQRWENLKKALAEFLKDDGIIIQDAEGENVIDIEYYNEIDMSEIGCISLYPEL